MRQWMDWWHRMAKRAARPGGIGDRSTRMVRRLRLKLAHAIIIDRAPAETRSVIDRVTRRRAAENYIFAGRFVAGKDVLDIGGGAGTGHGLLLACRAARVVSIDVWADGKRRTDPRLTYLHGDFLCHSFLDQSFDVLLCIGTIFLLENHDAAFRTMHRLLRPGGALIINSINPELIRRYFGMSLEEIDPKFTKAYTADELSDTLARYFHAAPEAYVQQPIADPMGRHAAIRLWIAPLFWLFGGHHVRAPMPHTIGMFSYFVVRKGTSA
jgi:SAM-dependent methyltransferase